MSFNLTKENSLQPKHCHSQSRWYVTTEERARDKIFEQAERDVQRGKEEVLAAVREAVWHTQEAITAHGAVLTEEELRARQ